MSKSSIKDPVATVEEGEVIQLSSTSSFGGQQDNSKQLQRNFKARHVNMLAIAGAIGTGLIIGSGTGLKRGGPASLFLGYTFTGSILMVVLMSLGEMAAFAPMDKAFSGYPSRYVDKALGFAAGWNYFFKYAVVLPANLSAVGVIIQYWRKDLNVGIFITVFLVAITIVNWFNVKFYGELEFWSAAAKLITLTICFLTCLIITCGGSPTHKTIGFQYWKEDAFVEYLVDGGTGKFLGFWACVIQACFAYVGSEAVGVVFGETPDPKKNIPKATKQVLFRISFFYIFGVFILGLAVSPSNQLLAQASGSNASASPFVIAIKTAQINVLPSFINACLLIFVGSSANTDLYLGSRTLYGLAKDNFAPKFFLKLNRNGVPFIGCLFTAMFGLLAYMNCNQSSAVILGYFSSAVTVFGILNWLNILIAYICYYKMTEVQNVRREEIPFRMWGQPYAAYYATMAVILITFFNGYNAFIPTFQYKTFITTYIGIAVYLLMIIFWKIYHKSKRISVYSQVLFNYEE
jgi:amino acid transporter